MNGVLFLVRGLPGSGKTSFASAIWNDYAVCEADKFFYDKKGNYNFDGSKLKEAHAWCKNEVESRMIEHQITNNIILRLPFQTLLPKNGKWKIISN